MQIGQRLVATTVCCLAALTWVSAAEDGALADAVRRQDHPTAIALLQEGTDPNEAQGDGMSALHWAAAHGDVEIASLLLERGARTEALTRLGRHTPLHVAIRAGRAEVVVALLTAGADPTAVTDTGATALHFAAGAGNADAIRVLVNAGRSSTPANRCGGRPHSCSRPPRPEPTAWRPCSGWAGTRP